MNVKRPNRILIIDDDPVMTAIYSKQFQVRQFVVEVAHDATAGFVALQIFKPDIVLLDLNMPERSGMDLLINIRGNPQYREMPVVILTAEPPESPQVKAAMNAAITGVLFKNQWNAETVFSAVQWALDQSRGVKAPPPPSKSRK